MPIHIYWLRNDLRLHDNETLTLALRGGARVLLVYVIDLRLFSTQVASGFRKTGPHRGVFLLQALTDIRERLQEIGADILIKTSDNPAKTVANLARTQDAKKVFTQSEITSEELADEQTLETLLPGNCELVRVWGKSLYHPTDLPFPQSNPRTIP